MSGNSFDDNAVSGNGGAIYARGAGGLVLSTNFFNRNRAGVAASTASSGIDGRRGGAIYAERDVELVLRLNDFVGNSAPIGAAVACCGGMVSRVDFADSVTTEVGGWLCYMWNHGIQTVPDGLGFVI